MSSLVNGVDIESSNWNWNNHLDAERSIHNSLRIDHSQFAHPNHKLGHKAKQPSLQRLAARLYAYLMAKGDGKRSKASKLMARQKSVEKFLKRIVLNLKNMKDENTEKPAKLKAAGCTTRLKGIRTPINQGKSLNHGISIEPVHYIKAKRVNNIRRERFLLTMQF